MKKILITVPNQHWIHSTVVYKLLKLQQDNRFRTTIKMPANKPYVNNLHHIVNEFVEDGYDFWLNIDADNPPIQNPLDLVLLDKDIIGLPTPIWHYTGKPKERPVYWNAYDYDEDTGAYREHQIRDGLQQVDAVGTGCVLISKRVFQKHEMRLQPFMRQWTKDGRVEKGNDMSFCEKARANGFKVYSHFDYPCDHFSEMSLTETVSAFRKLYE